MQVYTHTRHKAIPRAARNTYRLGGKQHVPKEPLHFLLSVPCIWIYSSESRAQIIDSLGARVYIYRAAAVAVYQKFFRSPRRQFRMELVLFKFNEKRGSDCDKFRIRWRGNICIGKKASFDIHATFCSPPLFVCCATGRGGGAHRAKLGDRAQRVALATNSSRVHLVLLSESWAENKPCKLLFLFHSKPLTGVKFVLNTPRNSDQHFIPVNNFLLSHWQTRSTVNNVVIHLITRELINLNFQSSLEQLAGSATSQN